jgi:hypothetical protein
MQSIDMQNRLFLGKNIRIIPQSTSLKVVKVNLLRTLSKI